MVERPTSKKCSFQKYKFFLHDQEGDGPCPVSARFRVMYGSIDGPSIIMGLGTFLN